MNPTRFRLSTLMVVIFDVAILLAVGHCIGVSDALRVITLIFVSILLTIILGVFTLMVVLGFGPRRGNPVETNEGMTGSSPGLPDRNALKSTLLPTHRKDD